MTRDNRATQVHHISYPPNEITCTIYKGEHEILTKLNRMTKNPPSRCFVEQISIWLLANVHRGIDLDSDKPRMEIEIGG